MLSCAAATLSVYPRLCLGFAVIGASPADESCSFSEHMRDINSERFSPDKLDRSPFRHLLISSRITVSSISGLSLKYLFEYGQTRSMSIFLFMDRGDLRRPCLRNWIAQCVYNTKQKYFMMQPMPRFRGFVHCA